MIMIPSLLKMSLTMGFFLNQKDDRGTGLHQFCLVQHTSNAQKVLKARNDQHQVIAGGGVAPMLADSAFLTASDGVTLVNMVSITWSAHKCLSVVL